MGAKLTIFPCDLDEANAFVAVHHRHHQPVRGHKFSVAVADEELVIHGVAICGRPVSRHLDNGLVIEVTRVATDGFKNAASALYGAVRRASFALGYKKVVTYTLPGESGASLRAAGYRCIGESGGGSWDRIARPRVDKHPTQKKFRWEVQFEEEKKMERINWKPFTAASRREQLSNATSEDRQTTYRKGTKWLRPELVGARVELFDEGTQSVFATAEVVSVKAVRFADIDTIDHERQSADMAGDAGLEIMRAVYGEYDGSTLTTVVTISNVALNVHETNSYLGIPQCLIRI